ncbi:MAG TPA: hypothetical protein VED40_10540 [Azospirillaceae bacterium]|nr:hypothetical protein [Azospirillaceae bacterium]
MQLLVTGDGTVLAAAADMPALQPQGGVYHLPGMDYPAALVGVATVSGDPPACQPGQFLLAEGQLVPNPAFDASPPPAPRRVADRARLDPADFFSLFTEAEEEAICEAALADAQVLRWYSRANRASWIDLDDPQTEAGLTVAAAIIPLAPERLAAIRRGELKR